MNIKKKKISDHTSWSTSSKNFEKFIRSNPNENVLLTEVIEKYLHTSRGNVFCPPKKSEPVILLLSGGVDSIMAWYHLLKNGSTSVHPVSVFRFWWDPQSISVNFFSKYFKKKFPLGYKKPFVLVDKGMRSPFAKKLSYKIIPPETLIRNYDPTIGAVRISGLSGANALTVWYALFYAEYLKFQYGICINTIYSGVTPSDGLYIRSQTLSYTRLINMALCEFSNHTSLQYSSVFFEKETNTFANKNKILTLAKKDHVPIWRSFSCDRSYLAHCGTCDSCLHRRDLFKNLSIQDYSVYLSDYPGIRIIKIVPILILKLVYSILNAIVTMFK